MSKRRVHEIAKSAGVTSKELLAALNAAGVEAKAAASSVEESVALKALESAGESAPAPKAAAKPKPPPSRMAPAEAESRRQTERAVQVQGEACRRPAGHPEARREGRAAQGRRLGGLRLRLPRPRSLPNPLLRSPPRPHPANRFVRPPRRTVPPREPPARSVAAWSSIPRPHAASRVADRRPRGRRAAVEAAAAVRCSRSRPRSRPTRPSPRRPRSTPASPCATSPNCSA